MNQASNHTAAAAKPFQTTAAHPQRHGSRCRCNKGLHVLLAVVMLCAHLVSPAAAAAMCGHVSVYVAGAPSNSTDQSYSYTLGTEWGIFPNEPLTESLCIQEAVAQSIDPQKLVSQQQSFKAGSYGTCSDVRGSADVGVNVNAMSKAGWPRLSVSGSSKSCWCSEGGSQPYVRLRVRQVTNSGSSSSNNSSSSRDVAESARRRKPAGDGSSSTCSRQAGRKVLAAMMPLWPDEEEDQQQQQQQQAGPDGCKGGALPGTVGAGHMVLLDNWYRVMRDETICQDSGLGHRFAIVLKLSDKC